MFEQDWSRQLWFTGNGISKLSRRLWLIMPIAISWCLLKARNDLIFNNSKATGRVLFSNAYAMAFEWIKAQGKFSQLLFSLALDRFVSSRIEKVEVSGFPAATAGAPHGAWLHRFQ
ncbi:hypothetical protein Ancab_021663 [Ancistrocladus abbreviatus]